MNSEKREGSLFGDSLIFNVAICLGLLVTAAFGIWPFMLGIILHSTSMQGLWAIMARQFAVMMVGNEPPPKARPKPSGKVKALNRIQHLLENGRELTIMLKSNGLGLQSYARFIMWIDEDDCLQKHRKDLSPVTFLELQQFGLEVSLESAMQYTLEQIDKGMLIGVDKPIIKAPATPQKSPVVNATVEASPEAKPSAPVDSKPSPENPQDRAAVALSHLKPPPQRVSSAVGKITSIDTTVVHPHGKKPYDSFRVIVQDAKGCESLFTGKELRDKFNNGEFKIGDTISIESVKVPFSVERGGEMVPMTKNAYSIKHL